MSQPELNKYLQVHWVTKVIRFLFRIYCRIVFKIYSPLTVTGKKNIQKNTPIILCSNHNSHMDTAILGIVACKSNNFLGALAAKDYWFDNSLFHFIANCMFQLIPIQRKNSKLSNDDSLTLEDTVNIAKLFLNHNDKRLVIYPEGTRSKTGKIQKFKDGASFFSLDLNIPIIPVYLKGIHEIWGKGKLFMRPHPFFVYIGAPIFPQEIDLSLPYKERAKKITKLIFQEIQRMASNG